MQHRVHMGGSDGILVGDRPHPRAWGTFPRYLARYTRELGLLGLEDCVAHLTGRPAARLKLTDRGLVREGYAADLVLFDPERITDTATFTEPRQQAAGIDYVLVNRFTWLLEPMIERCGFSIEAAEHSDDGIFAKYVLRKR